MSDPRAPVEPVATTGLKSLASDVAPAPYPAPPPSSEPPRRTPLAVWALGLAIAPWVVGIAYGVVAVIVGERVYPPSSAVAAILGVFVLGCFAGALVTGIVAIRRIRRSDGRLKGMGLTSAAFAVVLLTFAGSFAFETAGPGEDLLRDDFEGARNFWTGEDATVSKAYANGGYEVLIKDPDVVQPPSRSFFDEGAVEALSFSADVTIVRGPEEKMGIALGCWESRTAGYLLYVFPSGEYLIVDENAALTQGRAGPLRDSGQVNRISITCDAGGAGPTTLRLTANGEEVVRFEDPDGGDRFVAVGFHVLTLETDTLVRFDNALAVRK